MIILLYKVCIYIYNFLRHFFYHNLKVPREIHMNKNVSYIYILPKLKIKSTKIVI